jgi:Transglycosylase SLT domain
MRRVWHIACGIACGLSATAARADVPVTCEQAAVAAEQAQHLPPGLLMAIGRVESGRWDAARGQVVPWPWSIDAAGQGQQFSTKGDSVQAARALLDAGMGNVDVGCFQISLLHHPTAFTDLDEALDPGANARYAARFLGELHDRLGSWDAAVAAYHSANPELGQPYQRLVFANWAAPPTQATDAFGIHIWTPSEPGTAPGVIVLHAAAVGMPHVITPK